MEIIINKNSFNQSKKGNITSIIYFQHENFFFPEKDWSDFVVVILYWWNKNINYLNENGSELEFMDGDFSIKIEHLSNKMIRMYFFDNGKIVYELDFSKSKLKNKIQEITKAVVNHCDEKHYISEDLENLRSLL